MVNNYLVIAQSALTRRQERAIADSNQAATCPQQSTVAISLCPISLLKVKQEKYVHHVFWSLVWLDRILS